MDCTACGCMRLFWEAHDSELCAGMCLYGLQTAKCKRQHFPYCHFIASVQAWACRRYMMHRHNERDKVEVPDWCAAPTITSAQSFVQPDSS